MSELFRQQGTEERPMPNTQHPDSFQRLLCETLETASSASLREINSQFFGMMSTGRDFRDWKAQVRQRVRWVLLPVVVGFIITPFCFAPIIKSEILSKLITLPSEKDQLTTVIETTSPSPTPGAGATVPPAAPEMPRFETRFEIKQTPEGGTK